MLNDFIPKNFQNYQKKKKFYYELTNNTLYNKTIHYTLIKTQNNRTTFN